MQHKTTKEGALPVAELKATLRSFLKEGDTDNKTTPTEGDLGPSYAGLMQGFHELMARDLLDILGESNTASCAASTAPTTAAAQTTTARDVATETLKQTAHKTRTRARR